MMLRVIAHVVNDAGCIDGEFVMGSLLGARREFPHGRYFPSRETRR